MLSSLLPTSVREAAYRRKFLDNVEENLFMGSFESFAAAEAGAPPSKAVGYDNAEAAKTLYSHQVYFYDYPGLFWLGRSLDEGMRSVFDLGGHVGIKYYAFRRMLPYPADLRWTVCDVPGVVQTGRELAVQREVTSQLGFTTELNDASGCDVLYASGSLQYLPRSLAEIIAALPVKPRRIVLNTTAVHARQTLYTLNSIGFAVCPYRIQHLDALLAELTEAGYKRRDVWRNEGKPIEVPFVEGGDEAYYAGCCFDRL
jgi:putative methyltransferase (TIGR04325 family)